MAVVLALPLKTPGDCDGSGHNGMSTLRFGGKEMLEPHRKARGGRVESRGTEESQETIREGGRETDRERATASTPKASHSSCSEMSYVGVWSTDLVVFPLGFS